MKKLISVDSRLKAIASFVTQDGFAIDVGADHGYLSIYLVENGKSKRVLATDVREMPLACARRNIGEHHLSEKIQTQLTDGLQNVDLTEATDIIIAGMGGNLISEIIKAVHPPLRQNLVLQPMTQAPFLRKWLCENGYDILEESPAFAANKAYCVIHVRYDGQARNCDESFALLGKIPQSSHEDVDKYIDYIENKLKKKANGLLKSGKDAVILQETLDLVDKIQRER